jgi:AcrR family transcriptional regulator
VAATRQLISDGKSPSIDEIAAAADVSRRTIYMYYATLDQLILDATAGLLSETAIDAVLDPDRYGDDVLARVDGLARALAELAPESLPLGRKIISLTVDTPPGEGSRRGYRRLEWIERALEPAKSRLSDQDYERLVSALAVFLGWEAMIVLEDVRGLDQAQEEETIRWAARVLVEAALTEAARR